MCLSHTWRMWTFCMPSLFHSLSLSASSVSVKKDNPRVTESGDPGRSQLYSFSICSSPPPWLGKFSGLSGFACCAWLFQACSQSWSPHLPVLHRQSPQQDILPLTWTGQRKPPWSCPCHPHTLLPPQEQCKHMKHKEKPDSHEEKDRKW